jgi:hypothetical protein
VGKSLRRTAQYVRGYTAGLRRPGQDAEAIRAWPAANVDRAGPLRGRCKHLKVAF